MSRSHRRPGLMALLTILALTSSADAAPAPMPRPNPSPEPAPEPVSSFVGRLSGADGNQSPEVDLGVITSIRYDSTPSNQSIAISATKDGKKNLCYLQFNGTVMSQSRPGWTRAEPLAAYREIVAAARTVGSKLLCTSPISTGQGNISRVSYNGSFVWVQMGGNYSGEFQIVLN